MNTIYSVFQRLLVILVTILTFGIVSEPAYADCNQASQLVLSIPGEVSDPSDNDISVSGGLAPYSWAACGEGFSVNTLDTDNNNQLSANGVGCTIGMITVTDACGSQVQKSVHGTGTGGKWELVESYQGGCVIKGTRAEHYLYNQVGYAKFKIVDGQYLLNQQSGAYESHHHCTSDVCDSCCSSCGTLPPQETVSCIANWEGERCPYDKKESDTCITSIATTHGGCGAPGNNGCGDIYLLARCFHHLKQLYKWTCPEQSGCIAIDDKNLGTTCED